MKIKKNKGYIIVEIMVSIGIIITVMAIGAGIYSNAVMAFKKSFLTENMKMTVYNISNEIKYNMTYEEIEMMFNGREEVLLKYSPDTNIHIMDNRLNTLPEGEGIKIVRENDNYNSFIIECKTILRDEEILVRDKISKSWWMNEKI